MFSPYDDPDKTKRTLLVLAAVALPIVLCIGGWGLVSWKVAPAPNAQMASVRADMRSLGTSLESYFADHGDYPLMGRLSDHMEDLEPLKYIGGSMMPTFRLPSSRSQPIGLTTPIAYLTAIFPDPYPLIDGLPMVYYSDGSDGWILISAGPDGDYDVNPFLDYDSSIPQPSPHLLAFAGTYDPTNGFFSEGDLWRVKE